MPGAPQAALWEAAPPPQKHDWARVASERGSGSRPPQRGRPHCGPPPTVRPGQRGTRRRRLRAQGPAKAPPRLPAPRYRHVTADPVTAV